MKNDILILSFWQLVKINYYAKKYNICYFKKNIKKEELSEEINHELFLNKQGFLIDLMFFNSFFDKKQEQWLIDNINYNIINIKFVDFLNYSYKNHNLSKVMLNICLIKKINNNNLDEMFNNYFPHVINNIYENIKTENLEKQENILLDIIYKNNELIKHIIMNYKDVLNSELFDKLSSINEKNDLEKEIKCSVVNNKKFKM